MISQSKYKEQNQEIIGLIPAGGQATRIAPLPCSKELFPVGFRREKNDGSVRPKVVCHYLLEKMRKADVRKAYIILRNGKWDIPSYFGDGSILGMNLGYLMMNLPFGTPYTLDQAYPFVRDALVVFGFPDIIFQPEDAYVQLLKQQSRTDADIVLGLIPVEDPKKWDMVDLSTDGRITQLMIKPEDSKLLYAWVIAVWTPVFTHFMHEYLHELHEEFGDSLSKRTELYVGNVIQAAIDRGLMAESVILPDSTCLDIGTPDDLVQIVRDSCSVV